jgi:hypothetical protein
MYCEHNIDLDLAVQEEEEGRILPGVAVFSFLQGY